MLLNLNFNHLYYFYVVGRAQGLTEAAKLLRISQPSLSSQMKILESRLGIPLFQRAGRRSILSPEGQRLFRLCEKMFAIAENIEREADHERQGHQHLIRLGVSSDIERPFAVDIVSRAFLKEKRVRVRLISGSESVLHQQLQRGDLDFVLSTTPVFNPSVRTLSECDLSVVAGISKKTLRPGIKPKSLKDLPDRWVAPGQGQKLRREIDSYFESKRMGPHVVFESDVMGALIRAISDGLGWGLFPKVYLKHESQARQIMLLGPPKGFWSHKIYFLASQPANIPGEYERAFVDALRVECNS